MADTAVTIKAIEATAVHRIQSGQVIVNLCSVAKELVENSLDAGATSIEVRFKNQGLDSIEVQDNGSGIAPHNYASLALKHYTSKLANYDDLDTLQTFGFRGEALSSMCALSRFTVTTCLGADVPRGRKLEFETSGQLSGSPSVVAAQKGTTVSVENLFWNLPVRRRELERNIKREWTKVISLLNQYACIQTGVKFTVTQQPTKGKKVVLFSTKGNAATRDNIINVFGAKTMSGLLALDLALEMVTTRPRALVAFGDASTNETQIRVLGYVSRPTHGQGRQTPDRQMFYVNGRPCKLPQFAQLFGEVYRSYNSSQSPFIFADIQLDTHLYDVNVSPDKQTILLHDQGRMLDTLRESLIELFEKQDITVPMSQLASSHKLNAFKRATPAPSSSPALAPPPSPQPPAIREASPADEREEEDQTPSSASPKPIPPSGEEPSREDESLFVDDRDNYAGQHDEQDTPGPEKDAEETTHSLLPSSPIPSTSQIAAARQTSLAVYSRPPKRLSPEVATVTVGDQTISAPLITSAKQQKRQKLTTMNSSAANSSAKLPKQKAKAPLPSFGGRLSQMFSAAQARGINNNRVANDADEDEDGEEEEEEESENMEEEEENAEDEGGREELGKDVEEPEEAEAEEDLDCELDNDVVGPAESPNPEPEDMSEREPSPMEDVLQEDDDDVDMSDGQDHLPIEENDEDRDGEDGNGAEHDDTRQQSSAPELLLSDEDKRNQLYLKAGGSKKRHETLRLVQTLQVDEELVKKAASQCVLLAARAAQAHVQLAKDDADGGHEPATESGTAGGLDDTEAVAEAKLALTIVKSDFAKMRIVGQFNLGFILAVREATSSNNDDDDNDDGDEGVNAGAGKAKTSLAADDELFIIDQHASDEKYNFERLQASTVVQSQRLVQPKRLELTAVEEEIVLENLAALSANGFEVDAELDGSVPVGSRCRLRTLPLSRETTFDLSDLEELIALLGDHHQREATAMVRPAKVRKMFAMRACRSSIMIGKALSRRQMAGVLSHMGEMDKPWNCPHGRPTMRHLCSLGAAWDKTSRTWDDDNDHGSAGAVRKAEWARFLKKRRRAAQKA